LLRDRIVEIRAGIPQEEFEKLSSENIYFDPEIEIKGEGKERKLYITILPHDPEHAVYRKKICQLTEEEMGRAEVTANEKEEQRWREAEKEILQEIADLCAKDRDPYAPPIVEERIRYMEATKATLEEFLSQNRKQRINFALDSINRWKSFYRQRAGIEKFGRVLKKNYIRISQMNGSSDRRKQARQKMMALQFHCQDLIDGNAVEVVIQAP